jgi:ribonuclease HIII
VQQHDNFFCSHFFLLHKSKSRFSLRRHKKKKNNKAIRGINLAKEAVEYKERRLLVLGTDYRTKGDFFGPIIIIIIKVIFISKLGFALGILRYCINVQ